MPAPPAIAQDHRRLSGLAKARTCKLNLEQAEAIRGYAEANPGLDRREMYQALGAQYGVAPGTIEDVVRHHTWRTEARRREALVASGLPVRPVTPPPAIVSPKRLREINACQVALLRAALTACWLLLMALPAFAQASDLCPDGAGPTAFTVDANQQVRIVACIDPRPGLNALVYAINGGVPVVDTRYEQLSAEANAAGWVAFATAPFTLPAGSHTVKVSWRTTGGVIAAYAPTVTVTALAAPQPVDCAVSAWSEWSAWSAWAPISSTQEQRTQTRTRGVDTQASNGGAACPVLSETATETRAITAPPDACAGAVALAVGDWTRTADGGASAQVFWTLGRSTQPVTKLTVYLDGVPAPDDPSYRNPQMSPDLRGFAGSRFRVPREPGVHLLSLVAESAAGCKGTEARLMPITVR